MAASTPVGPGRVFISYRRDDSAFPAGWLYDRLCTHLGREQVFKDVDSIDPGDDFFRVIEDAVGSCQVLLALIGDRWLDITDESGQRRLDDPEDFVRLEIEAALRGDVRVIPILVGRAPMPRSEQLPDSLRGLIRRNAIELSPSRFESDLGRLVRAIDKTLAVIGEGRAVAPKRLDGADDIDPRADDHPVVELAADQDWAEALAAFFAKRWPEAVQRLEALGARYPDEARVQSRLAEARRQRDIAAWSDKAEAATADGDWDTAVSAWENLTALDPEHPGAAASLEQARSAQRRLALIEEMTALHHGGQWAAVLAAADELTRIDPDNPDPDGIVSQAQAKLRHAELTDRYAQALNHLDQQHWQQAADLLAAIDIEHPGYRDAAALLTTARDHLDAATPPAAQPAADAGARRDPGSTGAATESTHGARPVVDRGAGHVTQHDGEPGPTRQRRRLVPTLVLAGVLAVIGAVVLAVLLARQPAPRARPTGSGPDRATVTVPAVTATVPVGKNPRGVAVDPGTNTVYVTNEGDNTVSAIDAATRTVTATVPVDNNPIGVAVDPGTHTVYVTVNNKVSVIDAATRTVTATVPVGTNPIGVAVDPGTHTVYVTNYRDPTVSVIDAATRTVTATVPVGKSPMGVAVDPGTHTVYVANAGDTTVSMIDTATRTVTATVPVGTNPIGVAVDPGTHTVYVTNRADDTVSVIDAATRTVTATVPVGGLPDGVAVVPGTHTIYVTNSADGDNAVSVINRQ